MLVMPFRKEIMLPIGIVSCICLFIGQASSSMMSYGNSDVKFHADINYYSEKGGGSGAGGDSATRLHTFDIMVPSNFIAQTIAQEIFKKGSHQNYMTLNFLRSRFCYGNKVMLQISTDDIQFFGKTLLPGDERAEVSWVKDAISQKNFEDVMEITDHSYHTPFEDKARKCMLTPHDVRIHEDITIDGGDGATVNIGCLMKCALKCGPNPSCILPCVLECFGDNKDKA